MAFGCLRFVAVTVGAVICEERVTISRWATAPDCGSTSSSNVDSSSSVSVADAVHVVVLTLVGEQHACSDAYDDARGNDSRHRHPT